MSRSDLAGRRWLILGASSPVARAFARQVAAAGADVTLAGRDRQDLALSAADIAVRYGVDARVVDFDARNRESRAALAATMDDAPAGRLDVLLAFAAMPEQAEMEADPDLAIGCVEATYVGAIDVLLRLAQLLERAPGGRVVVLGSVAGDRGRLKNHVYGSAKAGLHAFAEGFRARMFRKGVTVTTVKPGFLDTGMTWGMPGIFLAARPDAFARTVMSAALAGRESVYVPGFWALIMLIIRHIPARLFKRLSI